jgi:protein PhnA
MSEESKPCPQCKSPYAYPSGSLMMCPECGFEWNPDDVVEEETGLVVKDVNGVVLKNGDSVVVIKDLPIKGSSQKVKSGTKVRNIRITDGDHNIDCKIDGLGSMALKSEYVKKA